MEITNVLCLVGDDATLLLFSLTNPSDVYNALTIHGLAIVEQLPNSVLDVSNFWKLTCYSIGGMVFSLDDIEHGVLRGGWLLELGLRG